MTDAGNGAGPSPVDDAQWLGLLARRVPVDLAAPGRVEVLALDATSLVAVRPLLQALSVTGWDVSLSYWEGEEPAWDGSPPTRARPDRADQGWAGGLRELRGLVGRRPRIDHRQVPQPLVERWGEAALVVPLDSATEQALASLCADGAELSTARADGLAAALLAQVAARGTVRASDLEAARAAIGLIESSSIPTALWTALGLALLGGSQFEVLRELVDRARDVGVDPSAGTTALGAIADLSAGRSWQGEMSDVVRDTLDRADVALAEDDLDRAAVLAALAQRVLFHREVHTSSPSSPLVEAPQAHLAPLEASEVIRRLRGAPVRATSASHETQPGEQSVAVVLPGAYPSFAGGVTAALEPEWQTRVVPLGEVEARFRNTEVDAPTLRELWDLNVGAAPSGTVEDLAAALADARLVCVDWADKGAVLATRLAPTGARVVLRVNGVDTLSSWVHLVNWDRVDTVVFVSEHLRRSTVAMLGERLVGVEQVVVPHAVDVTRYVQDKPATAGRVLGMVGWAQRVKDPAFALEVLALLRADDPAWRLRLVGPDFAATGTRSELAYAEAFRQRLLEPDVLGAVDFVGAVPRDRVPEEVREIGFALSTSVRESWHVGAMEMLAGGAVPVIRDWPLYAGLDGAAGLFPPESVVTTPKEAADRIRRFADAAARVEAGRAARDFVAGRYAPAAVQELMRRALTGSSVGTPPNATVRKS